MMAADALVYFLVFVLASAAVHKLMARARLAAAAARLLQTSPALGEVFSLGAATVEAVAAVLLLIAPLRPVGAVLAALIWMAYGVALLAARLRRERIDCGCRFGGTAKHVDRFAVAQAFVLAGAAALIVWLPTSAGWPYAVAPFAGFAFFTIFLAVGELSALPYQRRSIA